MKFKILFLLFFSNLYAKSTKNCNDINPIKASDCVLSEEDKKLYKYCCLEEFNEIKYCYAYDQSNYELQKETYKLTQKKFGTDFVFECNYSNYLKLSIIYFILLLI